MFSMQRSAFASVELSEGGSEEIGGDRLTLPMLPRPTQRSVGAILVDDFA